jgi:phosphonate transport system ATP-binding protein
MTAGVHFQLRGVRVEYANCCALDSIDLDIQPGNAVALVGPSGAGKTTLLGLLNGTVRPTRGTVAADEHVLSDLSASELRRVRADIGFIHQDLALVPSLRALQNVLAGRLGRISFLQGLRDAIFPSPECIADVYAILDRVGISEKLYEPVRRLSGGQRQRVAIARALYQHPRALLADEPVSSVDPARARDAVALLVEISRERKLTLCVSLHNLELAREFFPRLIGLRGARIVFDRSAGVTDREFSALYDLRAEDRAS